MSETGAPLSVVPAALQGASAAIGSQAAPLTTPSVFSSTSMETAAVAGAALDRAVDAYCEAFAQRMSAVSAGLTSAAGAYTGQEATSAQALAALTSANVV